MDRISQLKKLPIGDRVIEVSSEGLLRDAARQGPWKAGTDSGKGYRVVGFTVSGRPQRFLVHRLVAAAFFGPAPLGSQVDHKNGKRSDNRAENLRYLTNAENGRAKRRSHGTVGLRGVSKVSARINAVRPFVARIRKDGKNYYIGYYETAEAAALAYDARALEMGFMPECLNFPPTS